MSLPTSARVPVLASTTPTEDLESALDGVLTALVNSIDKELSEAYDSVRGQPMLQAAATALQKLEPQTYFYALQYPFQRVEQGLLREHFSDPKIRFVFEEYQFIIAHLRALFETYEGSACCADKARTVLRAWLRFLQQGKPIVWDREQEHTFHLPVKVLAEHESIEAFFMAITRLRYGRFDLYLAFMQALGPVPEQQL